MRKKTILLSILGGLVGLAVLDGAVSLVTAHAALAGPVDLSHVRQVRISGTASDITIATRADGKAEATLSGERRGWGALWHSAWFSNACPAEGAMTVEGDTLVVTIGARPLALDWRDWGFGRDWDDCRMTLSATLRPDAAVVIDQRAARMRLSGDFSTLDMTSDAGDFAFTGHAMKVAVSGAALRARLAFERVMNTEEIRISGKMLDASLHFLVPTPIAYGVDAVASYVDSALPNTPGARPDIRIRGEMVRVRIE